MTLISTLLDVGIFESCYVGNVLNIIFLNHPKIAAYSYASFNLEEFYILDCLGLNLRAFFTVLCAF